MDLSICFLANYATCMNADVTVHGRWCRTKGQVTSPAHKTLPSSNHKREGKKRKANENKKKKWCSHWNSAMRLAQNTKKKKKTEREREGWHYIHILVRDRYKRKTTTELMRPKVRITRQNGLAREGRTTRGVTINPSLLYWYTSRRLLLYCIENERRKKKIAPLVGETCPAFHLFPSGIHRNHL